MYVFFILYSFSILFTDVVNHSLYHFTIIHKNIDFIGIKSRKPVLNPYRHGDDNRIDVSNNNQVHVTLSIISYSG